MYPLLTFSLDDLDTTMSVVSLLMMVGGILVWLYATLSGDATHNAVAKSNPLLIPRVLRSGRGLDQPGRSRLYRGQTPLHIAMNRGNMPMVKLLLEHGANPNIPNPGGLTPLVQAVVFHNEQLALWLLNHGAEVNQPALIGLREVTPLIQALNEGHQELIRLMVDRGADLGVEGFLGDNLLHWAAAFNDLPLAGIAIDGGVDLQAVNSDGLRPVDIARRSGHWMLAGLLEQTEARRMGEPVNDR